MKQGAFKRMTVAVDGSPESKAGVRFALRLAGDDTTLFFCSAVDPIAVFAEDKSPYPFKSPPLPSERHEAADAIGAESVREAKGCGVSATSAVVDGSPARAILRYAHERGSDAIVMGSHGRTGLVRTIAGSVAEEVIRHSDVPVAVTHLDDRLLSGPIAVAIDSSPAADAALSVAIALARAVPCEMRIFHVFGRADFKLIDGLAEDNAERADHASLAAAALLEEAADRAKTSGVACEGTMLEGHPAQELLEVLDRGAYAIAVVGTHGHSEIGRLLFGSVAAALVERARVPILVVRRAV